MAWGTACNDLIEKIYLLQKKAIRIISNSGFNDHTKPIFKKLNILNIRDVFKHQIALFMYEYEHGNLPIIFDSFFKKVKESHSYNTRSASLGQLTLVKTKTVKYGGSMLKSLGVKIFNQIKGLEFFSKSKSKHDFSKKYKNFLIMYY